MVQKKRNVFVTGASRGIGKGIANWFIENGYNVAFGFKESVEYLHNPKSLPNLITLRVDIEDRVSIKKAIQEAQSHFGDSIDILVNNAAIAQEKEFENITDADWDKMLAVNLRGAFSFSQEVIPAMKEKKWGRIVNISSIGGQVGGLNQVHYAASKAAIINLTMSIAKLYSDIGITCNCISPGLIKTDMSNKEIFSKKGKNKIQTIPLKRVGSIEEIVDSVGFLASEKASYITGQTINVNGGMYFG